jgi:hypothetical protein
MGEENRSEVLMILQPRAIPEAIESLNKLDIEKVWFRGFDEYNVVQRINQFIEETNYDYYWIIADDVVVDGKPIELLRPLMYEGHVVTGYCRMAMDTEITNVCAEPLVYQPYHEWNKWEFFNKLKLHSPKKYAWMDGLPSPPPTSQEDEWWEYLFFDFNESNFLTIDEISSSSDSVIFSYLTGWGFTGASKEVWLKYPFKVSLTGGQSDVMFSLRYAHRDNQPILTHKEAYFTHLKGSVAETLIKDWLVGLESPIIYVGDGKRHKMQIDAHNIWWNEEEETFQPYDKFKIIQPYEYNMYADEHNMEEDDDFDF